MKKIDEMRTEYRREDLGKGVRGKHYAAFKKGSNLVLLTPELAKIFPNTEAGNTDYRYDTLDRLTAATYTNQTPAQTDEAYSYDPVANRLTDARTADSTWVYNENNQLTQISNGAGTLSYTYDANGNSKTQTDSANAANTRNFVYDIDNRLTEVRDADNVLIAAYSYDPFGRRISKDAGTQKTYYFYNAEGLIAEADAFGQVTKSYGYAPGSTFTTNPLWQKSGTAYYTYQNDHLGTPQKMVSQTGAVVWSATYDAFGKATVDSASSITNNLRFPGQYEDAETGLHYNWHRYYDPSTGRYSTSDSIGLLGGINEYAYVEGNAIGNFDPRGLASYHLLGELGKAFTSTLFGKNAAQRGEENGREIGKKITIPSPGSGSTCYSVCTTACLPTLDVKFPSFVTDQLESCTNGCTSECRDRQFCRK